MTVTLTQTQGHRQAKGKSGKRISERGERRRELRADPDSCPILSLRLYYVQKIIIRDLLKFSRTFSLFDVQCLQRGHRFPPQDLPPHSPVCRDRLSPFHACTGGRTVQSSSSS